MENITVSRKGNTLTLTIDLGAEGVPSASGKTLVVATTRGNADVPGDGGFKLGLNLYKYPSKR